MSELLERRIVRCPYHLAQRHLARAVAARTGAPGTLTLTAALPGADLVREVVVTYDAANDPMHFDQPWRLHWKPKAGPYPEFDGELTVRADENYETSQLELRGSYRPPGGVLGAAFDATIGRRIATVTAQALLERIASELETAYLRDEQSKSSATSS